VRTAPALRDFARRFLSRRVLLALAAELVLAIIDVSVGRSVLDSSYLLPILALAVVENGERTALAAAVGTLLALLSGVWHHYLFHNVHLYRLAIVAGGGALGVLGATFRSRATLARDQIDVLARIGEIADGTGELDVALSRLAEVLVPRVADLCEVFVFEADDERQVVSRVAGAPAGIDHALRERVVLITPAAMESVKQGPGVLVRDIRRGGGATIDPEEQEALRAAEMCSVAYVPVRAAHETLALLILAVGPSGRRFGPEDLRFARTVGSRAGLAIRNARLMAELLEARQRMEAVVGSMADAVTIRDATGHLIYANDAAMHMMGLPVTDDIAARDPGELFNEFLVADADGNPLEMNDLPSVRLLAGSEPEPLVLRFIPVKHGGEEQWRLLKSTPLYDARGQLEAAVTVIEDITATKRAEQRMAFLSRAGEILASSLDYQETLGNVAWLAVPEIADWCAVDLVDERGERQQVVVAHADARKLELARRLRELEPEELDPDIGLGYVLRTGKPLLYRDISQDLIEQAARDAEHLHLLRSVQLRSAVIVPLVGTRHVLGAMTLVNAESGRLFSEGDVEFLQQVAARAAVAVENAHLFSERARIADTLQHSLLPDALPDIEGWEVASLYRPATAAGGVEVGGDFYDAFRTASGWMLLIGDVTGKGVEAAAMTSLVRHGARFVSEYVPEPAEVLAQLDRALRGQPALSLCTALCVRIEGDRATFASAGHPLPLLVTEEGVKPVGMPGSVLGAFEDGEWPMTEVVLRPGELLLLYTDGVTDTVGEGDRFGEVRLVATAEECGPQAPEELLGCLDQALSRFQVGPQADDTAALALRLAGDPETAEAGAARGRAEA
jgi:serine phosphatase RsbU (regulator of sigma subunit)/PAS domain-containing protein